MESSMVINVQSLKAADVKPLIVESMVRNDSEILRFFFCLACSKLRFFNQKCLAENA